MAAQFARPALHGVRRTLHHPFLTTTTSRLLSTTSVCQGPKPLPPRPTINEDDITESFLKGSGPGGQKINKTSSAVQLKHLPTGIVVKYQGTRSRTQNRKVARRMLAERLEEMEKGDESRTQIKRAAQAKKKASKAKKSKRKYRALEEAKKAGAAEEEPTEEAVDEDEEWEDVEADPPNEKENEKKTEQQHGRPNNP
ncbi:putative peptidyl-tRNA hydrolase domain protein [Botryosphaeria dothidea]|uniref:Peptidyl-tRNA hydrolase domain protein n=1 Tax=Botryosphaeria dothidea TaxID=55169 RepID=A0A8H4J9P5_9PEZI|nr:putative peptidyl-tRNA hydrolase domain protein [Botryosphaeria dothidea]